MLLRTPHVRALSYLLLERLIDKLLKISSDPPFPTRICRIPLLCWPLLALFTGMFSSYLPSVNSGVSLSLANQEVLRWQLAMQKELGNNITHDNIKEYLWKTLKSGQVVPGYGHGVLRNPDPRFIALQEFCQGRPELKDSPIIQLVNKTFEVAPGVLKEHGKVCPGNLELEVVADRWLMQTKNPYPNVDATSGCVLYHYGLTEFKVCFVFVLTIQMYWCSTCFSITLSSLVCRVPLVHSLNLYGPGLWAYLWRDRNVRVTFELQYAHSPHFQLCLWMYSDNWSRLKLHSLYKTQKRRKGLYITFHCYSGIYTLAMPD